jgi:hypothetical protein
MERPTVTMPRSHRAIFAGLCFGLIGVIAACASIQLAGASTESEAKSFRVDASRGRIYVVRPGKLFGHGAGVALPVVVDGATVGANANATFVYVDVAPGLHRVSSQTIESFASVEIEVEAGRVYFVAQRSRAGLISPRVGLALVEPSSGMRLVSKARLVAGTVTRPHQQAMVSPADTGGTP